jgi:hypothetical protein
MKSFLFPQDRGRPYSGNVTPIFGEAENYVQGDVLFTEPNIIMLLYKMTVRMVNTTSL